MPYKYTLDFEALLRFLEARGVKINRWWNPIILEFETEEQIPTPSAGTKERAILQLFKEEYIPN